MKNDDGQKTGWWLVLGAGLLLLWLAGAWVVMRAPIALGDAYPAYSSLRTDPLGAKALYESLQALPEVSVSRAFRDNTELDAKSALILLGVNAAAWPGKSGRSLVDYEKLLAKGGRLVIGFLPVNPGRESNSVLDKLATRKKASEIEKNPPVDQNDLDQRWNIRLIYRTRRAGEEVVRGELPRHTALSFEAGEEWKVLVNLSGLPVVVERPLGAGSVVLIAESYPLSNEGLRDARDAELLAGILGPMRRIVFDENHLGVSDSGSVAGLMRKYHLEGAVGVLLVAALLFIWRNSSSFLPPAEPLLANVAASGRDTQEGMASLLRRSTAEKNLIQTCYAEWTRVNAKTPNAKVEGELVSAVIERSAGTGPVETYRAVGKALDLTKLKPTAKSK